LLPILSFGHHPRLDFENINRTIYPQSKVKSEAAMTDKPTSKPQGTRVGHYSPPAATRFGKGKSGNPAGRPKGARTRPAARGERLRSLMLEEAYRPVTVTTESGAEITIPMAQAVLRSLAEAAVKGEARAQAMFLKIVSASEMEEASIAEMLDEARQAETEAEQPVIEVKIVDGVDGRPTGREKTIYPYGGGPKDGKVG
jgi:hypothetical protein